MAGGVEHDDAGVGRDESSRDPVAVRPDRLQGLLGLGEPGLEPFELVGAATPSQPNRPVM
ncbi:MAG: hypothetical protein WDA60_13560 [Acidimicrobiia bacterium]|jgi:hypothetical protein